MQGKINIQLLFNGNASDAIDFYSSVFKTKPAMLHKMSDAPDSYKMKSVDLNRIMHCEIKTGGLVLMISDSTEEHIVNNGGMVTLSLNTDTLSEATRLFEVLSVDGNITYPLQDVFWNAKFGAITDKFGVYWVINYSYEND